MKWIKSNCCSISEYFENHFKYVKKKKKKEKKVQNFFILKFVLNQLKGSKRYYLRVLV